MDPAFPNESAEYRSARNALLAREIELRRATEAVAAARRALPAGGEAPQDYVFTTLGPDGLPAMTLMSGLFAGGSDTLMIYHLMYGPAMAQPCPMCSLFLDTLNGVAQHANARVSFVISAASPLPRILAAAKARGWDRLRFVSSHGSSYNRDYLGEDASGEQMPMFNVFRRDGDTIRHFWGSEMLYAPADPGQDPRHVDSIDALWNLFDLAPEGRG